MTGTTYNPTTLARESLCYFLKNNKIMPSPISIPEHLKGKAGAFVSLKKQGNLRGCIGTLGPTRESLAQEIIYNAVSAGTEDPRFKPVTVDEVPDLEISVDILSEPEPIYSLAELNVKEYGVIVRSGHRSGLLLPDLEGIDHPQEQVQIAMQKAGINKKEEIELYRFTVTRYK